MQANNDILKTSVLVIGQSGVGKSSLLNYIFNSTEAGTRTGKACTERGIYPYDFQYDDSFTITIYDTWGLEPTKDEDWKNLIFNNISKNDNKDISDWLNTIIVCINVNSNRVQKFELGIIKELLDDKRNIIAAITQCQTEDDAGAYTLKRQLINETNLDAKNIIFVNSVSKKLIGKTQSTPTFGREKIIRAIIGNMWKTFKAKVPGHIKSNMLMREKQWLSAEYKVIDKFKFPVIKKNQKIDSYVFEINNHLDKFIDGEVKRVNDECRNAIDYYSRLSKKFVNISLINSEKYQYGSDFNVNVRKSFSDKVDKNLEKLFSRREKLIELANYEIRSGETFRQVLRSVGIELGMYFSNTKALRENLRESTRSTVAEFNKSMCVEIDRFDLYIKDLRIEKVFLDQLNKT